MGVSQRQACRVLGQQRSTQRHPSKTKDDAAKAPGNSGLKMTLSEREARRLGKEFVGEGYSTVRGKKGELWHISADGKRMYRSPTPKTSDYAKTGRQANFHERRNINYNWWDAQRVSNVHVHVE